VFAGTFTARPGDHDRLTLPDDLDHLWRFAKGELVLRGKRLLRGCDFHVPLTLERARK
jgi:hypothetical protein